jgi:type IV pilus assembly protein PilB
MLDLGCTEEQLKTATFMKGVGCATCNGSGYKGRIAFYEVMRFTEPLKERVLAGASTAELKLAAIKEGMATLRMSALNKLMQGVTSAEEVARVTMSD